MCVRACVRACVPACLCIQLYVHVCVLVFAVMQGLYKQRPTYTLEVRIKSYCTPGTVRGHLVGARYHTNIPPHSHANTHTHIFYISVSRSLHSFNQATWLSSSTDQLPSQLVMISRSIHFEVGPTVSINTLSPAYKQYYIKHAPML